MRPQLRRLTRKCTPPTPSRRRRDPDARPHPDRFAQLPAAHGQPYTIGPEVHALRLPHRPIKPAALNAAETRAAHVRRRPLLLRRPELHRHHDHAHITELVDLVAGYVLGRIPARQLPPFSPYARWVVAARLEHLEETTPKHRWGELWRLDDMREAFALPRRDRIG